MSDPWQRPQEIAHRMRDELTRVQQESSRTGPETEAAPSPTGTGEALDGKVEVMVSGGRITDVRLDPRAMRVPSQELAAAFRDAANAAIAAQNSQVTAGTPTVPSIDRLAQTLDEITAESVRTMEASAQGVRDAIAAVQRVSELHRRRREP
jgi:hypothetical protein